MAVRTYTFAERPDLAASSQRVMAAGWPAFVLASLVAARHFARLVAAFPDHQLVLVDDDGALAGVGHSVPFRWDGAPAGLPSGWDGVVEAAMADLDAGRRPTAAAALSITVAGSRLGRGHSRRLLQGLRDGAVLAGLGSLVAPVRPTRKSSYPLIPMERYVAWRRPDGSPFDPWIRVHWRLGARLLDVCPASMRIAGTVAEWERWAGMPLPESGSYVVPGALVPVEVDHERDEGTYVEPNVWMHHRLAPPHAAAPAR